MRQKIISILHTHTFRQSAITVLSTFLSAGLGAVFYVILARVLGQHDYGSFYLALTVFSIGVTLCDVGMGQGIVRFVGENRSTTDYFPYAKLALKTKIITGTLFILVLSLFSRTIAGLLLHQPEVSVLLPFVGLAVLAQILFSFTLALSQGLQKFFLWGGVQIGSNLFRLLLLAILIVTGLATPISALVIVGLASLAGFLVSWIWFNPQIVKSVISRDHSRQFWHFNKWTASFIIISSIVSRLDILITGRFLNLSQTGIYSWAVTMSSFLPQLSSAIGVVTSSKFAGLKEHGQAGPYLIKATYFSTAISFVVAILMLPTAYLFTLFTGKGYSGSLLPFIILLISLSIFTSTNPVRDSLLFYHHKPNFFVWAAIGQGIVLVLSSYFLIPVLGIIGSSLSVLASHIFLSSLSLWYYVKQLRSSKN